MSDKKETASVLEFDLVLQEVEVRLRNEKTGAVEEYILRELDGAERDAYLNKSSKRVRTNSQGSAVGVSDFDNMQAELLVIAMRHKSSGKNVELERVRAWPARVQERLYDQARTMSGLDAKSRQQAKND